MAQPINPKQNVPNVGELVMAQISKVMPFGAYVKMLEYDGVEAYLPIKEVSSGWIKNIHEFIHEGQKVVCKVVFYDKEKQTLDVSLKKVTPAENKQKVSAFNLEKRLNALFLQSIRFAGLDQQKVEITQTAIGEFHTFTNLMRNATDKTKEFEGSKLPKKLKDEILKRLETSRKKKRYIVAYIMKLTTYNTKNGATELRDILSQVRDKGIEVSYISAPKYHLTAEGKDYSDAENKIKAATELVQAKLKKGDFSIEKEKLKKEKEDIMSAL